MPQPRVWKWRINSCFAYKTYKYCIILLRITEGRFLCVGDIRESHVKLKKSVNIVFKKQFGAPFLCTKLIAFCEGHYRRIFLCLSFSIKLRLQHGKI